jgi:hypothetical protein
MTIGIKEHTIFPETGDEEIVNVFGLAITIVTTAKTRPEALAFFEYLGFPMKKDEERKSNCIKEAHEQAESIKKQQEKLKFFSHFSILHWIKDDGEDFNFKYESNKKIIDFISETSELKFSIDSTGIKTYNWIIRDNQQFTDFYAKQMNISNKDSFYNKINAELKASFDSKNKVFYGTIEIWTRIDRGLKLDLISNEIVFLSELDSNSIIQKLDLAGFEKREMGKIII